MNQSHGLLNRVSGTISSLLIHSMSSDYIILKHIVLDRYLQSLSFRHTNEHPTTVQYIIWVYSI